MPSFQNCEKSHIMVGCLLNDTRSPLTEDFKNVKTLGNLLYQIVYRKIPVK